MILTRLGWRRSTFKQRVEQRKAIAKLPTVLSCTCNQCGCGGFKTVVFANVPICKGCGRPKFDVHGKPYGLEHLWCCHHAKEQKELA